MVFVFSGNVHMASGVIPVYSYILCMCVCDFSQYKQSESRNSFF